MNIYFEKLYHYLKENPPENTRLDAQNVLGYLTDCYLEINPVRNSEIQKIEKELGPYFEVTPLWKSDLLFQLVYDLCGKYEQAAFRAGLCIGVQLAGEVEKLTGDQ